MRCWVSHHHPQGVGERQLLQGEVGGAEVIRVARAEEARIDAEWTAHLGVRRMAQLRETLELLREITDPYA